MNVERLTIPDVRIDKNTIRRQIVDAEKVKEYAMEIYWRLKAIEDIIADKESEEYDLDRLGELAKADVDGRCMERQPVSQSTEEPMTPCDLCMHNPPSSLGEKPCFMCPAAGGPTELKGERNGV